MSFGRSASRALPLSFFAFVACRSPASDTTGVAPRAEPPPAEARDAGADPDASAPEPPRPNPEPGSLSGTRLRRELWSGGGLAMLRAFVDTARDNERCVFEAATDGSLRCLPLASSNEIFSAPGCGDASRLAMLPLAAPEAIARRMQVGTECSPAVAVHVLGAPMAPPATIYRRSSNGTCQAGAVPSGFVVRPIASTLGPETFVRATRRVAPGTTRLRVQQIAAEDGANMNDVAHDAVLDHACTPRPDLDGVDRCMAGPLVPAFYGADGCSAAPLVQSLACGAPAYAVHSTGAAGTGFVPLRTLPTAHVGKTWQGGLIGCREHPNPGPVSNAELLEATELAKLTRALHGDGRIQRDTLTAEDGSLLHLRLSSQPLGGELPSERAYDRTFESYCLWQKLDGAVACVPSRVSASRVYADGGCTQLAVFSGPEFDLADTKPVFVQLQGANGTVHRVGALVDSPPGAFTLEGGACRDLGVASPKLRALGPPEPATAFQTFTLTIE